MMLALQTRNVHKFYGTGRNAFHALRAGFDMDVPYGLLASLDTLVLTVGGLTKNFSH